LLDEVRLDVAHHLERELGREDAGVLPLVFLEDVGLHRAAHARQGSCPNFPIFSGVGIAVLFGAELLDLLVDRRVEEHRQEGRRRSVDGHRYRRRRIDEVEARVKHLHVIERGDGDARVADLAVDVGTLVGIEAVERDRIEGRGQALRRHVLGQQMEAPVGAERVALAREHARRVLVLALEGEHAGGVRELAGQVLAQAPAQKLAVVLIARQRDLRHVRARERGGREPRADLAVADCHDALVARIGLYRLRPGCEQLLGAALERRLLLRDELIQLRERFAQHGPDGDKLLALAGNTGLFCGLVMVRAHRLRNLRKVAHALRRHDGVHRGGHAT
jgi:hypothetical protein